jgi:hypothetical protein
MDSWQTPSQKLPPKVEVNQGGLETGANKGIGLQIAKDLVAHGFTVLVGPGGLTWRFYRCT